MKTFKVSIEFKTLPRFGKAGLDDQDVRDHLGADQFFSAISLAWIEVYGLDDYLNSVLNPFLEGRFPWLHSSFFPELKERFYIPAPLLNRAGSKSTLDKKERQPWIKYEALNKMLSGQDLIKEDYESAIQDYSYQAVNLNDPSDPKPYITSVLGPNIAMLDNNTKNASLPLVLSGFLDLADDKLLEKIKAVCDFLKDEGIGANRSSGYGQIKEVRIEEYENLVKTENPNLWITLSDYLPKAEELSLIKNSRRSAYKLISKSGWVYNSAAHASDKRKLKTYMMAASSSFDFKPVGSIINVGNPEHPSYRYGLAYNLGLKIS
ncbi:MAG: type III-A CRISPR-associated RAMP protein Csm4 [Proteobacteria bacterium]|nr:type III-A CRISPR-associated RAMP protein Csm4 [Pseudomonadota bacterium]